MVGEERDHAALFKPLRMHPGLPVRAFGRMQCGQPLLPAVEQRDRAVVAQVEGGPVVVRHVLQRHPRAAQGHREGLQRQRYPQCLVVGQGAAGGEVAEGAVRARRIAGIAEHAGQLQAGAHFQFDGDGSCILADVVGVVGQGQDLRGKARQ